MTADLSRFMDAVQRTFGGDHAESIRTILDIGCGQGHECRELLDVFQAATLIAVETDEDAVRQAQTVLSDLRARATVIHGDAAALSTLAPGTYDLIVIRHPDVDRQPGKWNAIFKAAVEQVRARGFAIVTTYTLPEAAFVNESLEVLRLKMLPGSPYSALPVAMTGIDRYILIYEKPE